MKPVPLDFAHMSDDGAQITILGVNYSLCVFETLAKPDPTKTYRFGRTGETVTVTEVKRKTEAGACIIGGGKVVFENGDRFGTATFDTREG